MRRVERFAWNAVLRCVRAKKLTTLPLPIPVEAWIEGPLGIHLLIADLTHLGPGVLGYAMTTDNEIAVSNTLVNQEGRFRFTAAHELGHVLLHKNIASEFRDTDDGDFMERRIEREADRFAAAFLMPLPALCTEFSMSATTLWSDPQSMLHAVARGDAPARDAFRSTVLPHITKKFGVSLSAAVRRFSDVQFPSGEPALPFDVGLSFLPNDHIKEALRRK